MFVETYFAARWLEGGAVAALLSAVFLLANPGFIYVSRMSASGVGLSMNVLWLGALLCLRQWVRTKRRGWLYAASVMTGAGFCVRIWFWWFWSGLLAAAILYRRELSTLVESGRRRRTWGAAAAFFLLGLAPYMAKEATGQGVELVGYTLAHFRQTRCGVDNLAVAANIREHLGDALRADAGIVDRGVFNESLMPRDEKREKRMEAFFGVLMVLSVLLALRFSPAESRRRMRLIVVMSLAMFLSGVFTINRFEQVHDFILFPLPQILMGAASAALLEIVLGGGRGRALALSGLALYAAAPALYADEFVKLEGWALRTGGRGEISDSTFAMTDWLEREGHFSPKVVEWGPLNIIGFLSAGRVKPRQCDPGSNHPGLPDAEFFLTHCLKGDNAYIFNVEPGEYSKFHPALSAFKAALRRRGLRFHPMKTFLTRDGQPAFVVYSITKG